MPEIPHYFYATSYQEGLRLMEEARSHRQESIFFLEHPHTITLGKSTKAEDLLYEEPKLQDLGYEVHRPERGGRATYHGPGQLVAYPVVRLKDPTHIRSFVDRLANIVAQYLKTLSIEARYDVASPGLWVDTAKIAAIGLSVRQGMTGHGFALNLSCDLDRYRVIVPCGLKAPVTSVESILGAAPTPKEAAVTLATMLQSLFG